MALLGHPMRALVLVGAAGLLAVLIGLGAPVGSWVRRGARAAGGAIAVAGFGVIHVALLCPAWAWRRLRRRDPIRSGPTAWVRRGEHEDRATRSLGSGPVPEQRSLRFRLLALVGVLVVVPAADYAAGWSWDAVFDDHPPTAAARAESRAARSYAQPDDAGGSAAAVSPDPRATSPAMAGAPWAATYFADLQRQSFVDWPFTGNRPTDFASRYINVGDFARRSWTAPGPTSSRPVVWFFGGSTMFGEGQRDEHTISSEVARLAAAEGLPVTAVNYGQRGWVHWQEMLLFEQRLALEDAPDLVAFYDGMNDVDAGRVFEPGIPTPLTVEEAVGGGRSRNLVTSVVGAAPTPDLTDQIWAEYVAHSAVRKLARAVGLLPEPAAAAALLPVQGDTLGTPEEMDPGIDLYRRARSLTDHIARTHGVPVRHFLQPQYLKDMPAWVYVRERWPQPTTDLSDAMGDRADDVYLDVVHTNELGARLVATAMWAELRPTIVAWYRDHG